MTLIGLYSPAKKSGKSEVARILTTEFGFKVVKFADPLKNMLRSMYRDMGVASDTIEELIEGKLKELPVPGLANGVTGRNLQDTLGTNWGRQLVYQNVWVDITKAKIRQIRDVTRKTLNKPRVIVDDVRFPNEFAAIKELGGKNIILTRPGAKPGSPMVDGLLDHYVFDGHIRNDGSLETLRRKARELA